LKPLLVIVGGPTGIGKTATAIKLAQHFNTEIVSADSRQFFKELSIGTAVPSAKELAAAKHHFIHNLSIDDGYNASDYEEDTIQLLDKLFTKHKVVILAGGSGLYIDAVCKGIDYLPTISQEVRKKYQDIFEQEGIETVRTLVEKIDPEYYQKVDRNNHKRMLKALEVFDMTGQPYTSFLKNQKKQRSFNTLTIILDMDRTELYERINYRVDHMVEAGLIDEALTVLSKKHLTPLKTVGYKELFEYFEGNITKEEAITQIKNHSRAYARRQLTWFRRYEDAHWFQPDQVEEMVELIRKYPNS